MMLIKLQIYPFLPRTRRRNDERRACVKNFNYNRCWQSILFNFYKKERNEWDKNAVSDVR